MYRFKSHWFYWYTGHRLIAIVSLALNILLMWLVLVFGADFSIWGVVTVILLDLLGAWMALLYLVLRKHISAWWGLQEKLDHLMVTQLLIPWIVSLLLNRACSFAVAYCLGYKVET